MDINKINEKRESKNQPPIKLQPLLLNINGRRFRNDEVNIKLSELYDCDSDIDWSFPEIWDPWKRAKKHMELLQETFGHGRISQIRLDHFLEYTHICDVYKWFNRSYQLLKKGGILKLAFIDFPYLFKKVTDSIEDPKMHSNKKITEIQELEKAIFTTSDPSGMYYHRTILTKDRVAFYLKRSFFYDYEFQESYHEVLRSRIIEVRAIKDTDYKTELAPDGTIKKIDDKEVTEEELLKD